MSTKNSILIAVTLLIIGSIVYLQAKKPARISSSQAQDVVVFDSNSSSTINNVTAQNQSLNNSSQVKSDRTHIRLQKALKYSRAKELADIQGYINTSTFTLSDLVGKKVILVDFWTYSCINCQRTTPYLNAWYDKYKNAGLVIVGVHTPEFDFEKNYDNVSKNTKQLGIQYPVVLDSNYGTWNAYNNRFWPHEFLIDIDGYVVHDHIGEGGYDETEKAIQAALKERQTALGSTVVVDTTITAPKDAISLNESAVRSPETYFGAARNQYFGNGQQGSIGSQDLTLPSFDSNVQPNTLYLGGSWNFQKEYAQSTSAVSTILFNYSAKNVYIVASSNATHGTPVKIYQDGKLIHTITVKDNKLYTLIQGSEYGQHILKLEIQGAGLNAFTFTFG